MSEKYELSRRKALAALGTIGVAGAGAGMGTSALFTDEEDFNNNTLTAGELNLLVDYWTSQNTNTSTTDSGTQDGGVSALLELTDVKPGDDGKVVFCPKIVDNPAYLWAGSSGLTQYENGYTEPEGEEEDSDPGDDSIEGRSLSGNDPEDQYSVADVDDGDSTTGEGYGELANNVQVTVSYCEPSDDLDEGVDPSSPDDFQTVRELDNPEDYTLADLILELQTGFPISNNADGTYPASADEDDQAGVCLCIDWEVPTSVGNEIQSDSVEFDIGFYAEQSRNNSDPETPYTTSGFSSISYEKALGTQILRNGGSGTGEIQVHSDSGGAETVGVYGGSGMPTDTDIPFTVTIDNSASPPTATVEVNGETAVDDDITDGDANGNSTGDPEYPGGVPDYLDVAINVSSGGASLTTVAKDVTVDGDSPSVDSVSVSDGTSWLAIPNADATDDMVTVAGTIRFEGTGTGTQDSVGVDFR